MIIEFFSQVAAIPYSLTILSIILLMLCATPSIISIYRRQFDIFEPIVFFSVFMSMTTVEIINRIYVEERYLLHSDQIGLNFEVGFLILLLMYISFYSSVLAAYYLRPINIFDSSRYRVPVKLKQNILEPIGIGYIVVGAVFYILLVGQALDWNILLLYTSANPRSEVFVGSYELLLGARMMYIGCIIWIVGIMNRGIKPGLRYFFPIILASILFLLLGGRGAAISILLVGVILFYYIYIFEYINFDYSSQIIKLRQDHLHNKIRILTVPLIGVILGFVVVIAGILREWRDVGSYSFLDILMDTLTFGIQDDHLDYFLVLVSAIPDKFGYYWGTLVLRVPFNYIPRSLWESKPPLTIGVEIRELVIPDGTGGRPAGIIGQYFAEGGVLAVIFGGILFGLVLRALYDLLRANRNSVVFLLIYVLTAPYLMRGIGNNSLWVVSNHLLLLIPAIAIIYLTNNYIYNRNMDIIR